MKGDSRDADDAGSFTDDDGELRPQVGPKKSLGIFEMEGGLDGAIFRVSFGAEMGEFGGEYLVGHGDHPNFRGLTDLKFASEMFGDGRHGGDLGEIEDFDEGIFGGYGLTEGDIDRGNFPAERGEETNRGGWFAWLAALDYGNLGPFFDGGIGVDGHAADASGDATTDDGAMAGGDLDAS